MKADGCRPRSDGPDLTHQMSCDQLTPMLVTNRGSNRRWAWVGSYLTNGTGSFGPASSPQVPLSERRLILEDLVSGGT